MPKTIPDDEFNAVTGGSGIENTNDEKERIEKIVRDNMKIKPILCKTCGKSHSSFTNFALNITHTEVILGLPCGHKCRYTYKEAGIRVL